MTGPAYALATIVAPRVRQYLEAHPGPSEAGVPAAAVPDVGTIEALVDAGFWASLQREEGRSPTISLAFVSPDAQAVRLMLERPLPLDPRVLARLAPAVERPGIHLGVWPDGGSLHVWGALRTLPPFRFVLEVVSPGLLVVKHSRGPDVGKFTNVAVLEGDQLKMLDQQAAARPEIPELLRSLLQLDAFPNATGPGDVLIRLAVSMRRHGHGGTLLVVPAESDTWRSSMMWPVPYGVVPPFSRLADLMQVPPEQRLPAWHEALHGAVEGIAGLTAVDGATVITNRYDLLTFGAMIGRRDRQKVDEVLLNEPVEGDAPRAVPPTHLGGTRHQSAAQFVRDQPDTVALVASEDGRFSLLAWLTEPAVVQAYRLDALLL